MTSIRGIKELIFLVNILQATELRESIKLPELEQTQSQLIELIRKYDSSMFIVCQNHITDRNIGIISEGLKDNTSIIDLDLSFNQITSIGAAILAESLKYNTTINALFLTNNPIKADGLSKIIKILRNNKSLKKLYAYNSGINDEGIIKIIKSLKDTSLELLGLANNRITDRGAAILLDCLKVNTSITILPLHGNLISMQLLEDIKLQLDINKCNNIIKTISLQQRCYNLIKNNNIHCPESYKVIYDNTNIKN